MNSVEQKLDLIIKELAYLREEIQLSRDDSRKFAQNLDKQIKEAIKTSSLQIMARIKK